MASTRVTRTARSTSDVACELEWSHDLAKLQRASARYERSRANIFVEGNGALSRRERWMHRHPSVPLAIITGLVGLAVGLHSAVPLLPIMALAEYPVFGRWRDPKQRIAAARGRFLAERHVRLLKSPGGSAG